MTSKPIADVSKWQGDIDYARLIALTDGVIIRAGVGMAEDWRFQENFDGLQNHPGDLGVYWYVFEDVNGMWQAECFADVIGDRLVDFVVMDAEDNNAGLSKTALRARYRSFLEHLATLLPHEIRIYTRATFWDWYVGVAGWEQNYRGWFADYSQSPPRVPLAWNGVWTLHQYSADGNGLGPEYGVSSASIDLNRYNPEFYPPPPPEPGGNLYGTITTRVNFREYPVVAQCTFIRLLNVGERVQIVGEHNAFCGWDWYEVLDAGGRRGWVAKNFVEVEA